MTESIIIDIVIREKKVRKIGGKMVDIVYLPDFKIKSGQVKNLTKDLEIIKQKYEINQN